MPRFQGRYAEVNGIRLHYVSVGQGKLIMFVHGFPEFWYAWEKQLIEFGRDYQAVAPDMRGYNLSSKPADIEKYHAKDLIEDLRALAGDLTWGMKNLSWSPMTGEAPLPGWLPCAIRKCWKS